MKLKIFNGSKDYNKLNHLPFNRDFSVRQDLIKSMNKMGFIVPLIIIKTNLFDGKNKLYIADGQHRAITASFLNITFYGNIIEKEFKSVEEIVKFVARLNSGQKPWKAINYVESYNYLNYPEYKTLIKIFNNVPYTVDTTAAVLSNVSRNSGSIKSSIVSGNYKNTNLIEGKKTFELAAKLTKFHKPSARMLLSINKVRQLKIFNENLFIKNYSLNIKSILELTLEDYTDTFMKWT